MSKGKPLNVRVAEALGWKWWRSRETGRRCIYAPGNNPEWMDTLADGTEPLMSDWYYHCFVPPYGDDTPEGWACTGPLIQRFGLSVAPDLCHLPRWICYTSDDLGDEIVCEEIGPNACAAVAEWVARYGAEKEEK